ncbi:hypothetical protein B0H21DRAFT_729573 [Amylocystis lapponica]|nr:hypothetical protein B0H21DRAFT_729573 [Amylocystis lapponica]
MARPNNTQLFMSIAAPRGDKEESFEERRVEDYLHAYQTTGAPPAPCPLEPTAAHARAALGLPPIFQPRPVDPDGQPAQPNGHAQPNQLAGILTNGARAAPGAIPEAHVFHPDRVAEDVGQAVVFQSITFQSEFAGYSFEELRHSAYLKGQKFMPATAVLQQPLAQVPLAQVPVAPLPVVPEERLQSINCSDLYAKHSFEELRLAFLRTGRPLTSSEIIQRSAELKLA